jgi:LIM domain
MNLHRICRKCSKIISADEEFLYDGDIPLHIDCYTCSQCQQSLAGRFYYRLKTDSTKKRLVCETCYFRSAPVCFHCLKIIEEISLTYGERVFHPRCFRCDQCQTPFDGALLFPYGNQLYCIRCYAQVQTDFQPISTNICRQRCERCRKQFQPGDLITEHRTEEKIDEHYYLHSSCFVCEICHVNLSNSIYYAPKDPLDQLTFQCPTCHQTSSTICSVSLLIRCSSQREICLVADLFQSLG